MREPNEDYYSNSELVQIAENCNSVTEITKASQSLKYLHEKTEENIFLSGFNILAHLRIRQLIKIKKT